MKLVLIAFMTDSMSTGPIVPVFMTSEFDDRPACEAAARRLADLGRPFRVMGSAVAGECLSKASKAE